VTGGAGFIGSHLVRWLLEEGREVVIADDFSRGSVQNLRDLGVNIVCERMDLRNYEVALKVVRGVDTVFHLAARVGSVEYLHGSKLAELRALQDNLVIDANVFRACMQVGVKTIVYASSVSVYPIGLQRQLGVVFSEGDLRCYCPEGGYGWAKLLGEMELSWTEKTDIGIGRIFTVYGPCEPLDETAHVVPALIRKAIRYPIEDFVVWGTGEQTRSFLYVSDCVEALARIEERASSPPLVVNVGSAEPTSIKHLAQEIVKISGKDIRIKYDSSKPTGPVSRTPDITLARKVLGWSPRTSLDEGLRRTYAWAAEKVLGENDTGL